MTGGVDTSIEHVAKVLSGAELELTGVSHQLESYYSRAYSSARHTNIYALVRRLRAAQKDIETLFLESAECDRQRGELIKIYRSDLSQNYDFAKRAHVYEADGNEDGPLAASFAHRLATLDATYAQVMNDNNKANDFYLEKFDPAHRSELAVTPPERPPVSVMPSPTNLQDAVPVQDSTGSDIDPGITAAAVETRPPKPNASGKGNPNPPRKNVSAGSTPSSSQDGSKSNVKPLEPISKAVFNRLPRNLKIKAGKLSDVNSFYERVWHVFSDKHGGPLTDKQLMNLTGESSLEKFEVLRGLSMLRKSKQGWVLS